MNLAKTTLVVHLLIICILSSSCFRSTPSAAPDLSSPEKYETEILQLKEQLLKTEMLYENEKEKATQLKTEMGRLEVIKQERELFRKDLAQVLNGVDGGTLLSIESPVFIGMDRYSDIQKEHVNVIKEYLIQWKKEYSKNEDFLQEIEPIICFFSVAPKEPINMKINPNAFYYSVEFYSAAAAKIPYEEFGRVRGSFDGFSEWFLRLEKKDRNWYVVSFGSDS